jgi:alkylation response protein AidB-like acyl-CoA dehydrogenase
MTDSLRIIEALARADGAIGWCACTAAINNRLAGFLLPNSASRIFAAGRESVAGALMPTGKAEVTPDGYAISGRWGYGSGMDHCTWMLGACSVLENDEPRIGQDGTPETLIAFFPPDQCQIIDTWDVGGLRATGSHDYEVRDISVPRQFTVKLQGADPFCSGILYRLPYYSAQGAAIAPVVLGLAQAALDRYLDITESHIPRMMATTARNDPGTQEVIGRAAAALRASRAYFFDAVGELWSAVETGSLATLSEVVPAIRAGG